MIKCINFPEEPALPEKGVEAQKIRALLRAYGTQYDFCRFYTSCHITLCDLNGGFVICENGECDVEELAEFLSFNGFSDIFCSNDLGGRLKELLSCGSQTVNLMRFREKIPNSTETDVNKTPPLEDVYKILSTAFEIDFEPWYVDMSHRIRHGVSGARVLDRSALIIQHNINGEALLSQIATTPERRGQGVASKLILSTCVELATSEIYIICEDKLLPFYEKIGFEKIAEKYVLTRS